LFHEAAPELIPVKRPERHSRILAEAYKKRKSKIIQVWYSRETGVRDAVITTKEAFSIMSGWHENNLDLDIVEFGGLQQAPR
jgi:hypothetical protein